MPDTDNTISSNYHAVYEKDGGKVVATFNGSSDALKMTLTDRNKLESSYCGEAINIAFQKGKSIIRQESGVMEIQNNALDPAAIKYMEDRKKHNDMAEEHSRLQKLGQKVLPGIRFQDAAEVGRVWEMKGKGDLSETEWDSYTNELIKDRRVTIMTREDYEKKPPFDDEYTGPRFKYGMINRPYGMATAPKGAILMTYKPEDKELGSRHGTIEYPFELTKDDVYSFELVDFQHATRMEALYHSTVLHYETEMQRRGFTTTFGEHEQSMIAVKDVFGSDTRNISTRIFQDAQGYHLDLCTSDMDRSIEIVYETPEQIDISRSLKWIDIQIASMDDKAKVEALSLALAKADTELSYTELTTITGLSKDDIEKHWTAANEKNEEPSAYITGKDISNHAHALKETSKLRLKNSMYDPKTEINKMAQADFIVGAIKLYDLNKESFKLDYQAAMGGNPLAHDNEARRQIIIDQINIFAAKPEHQLSIIKIANEMQTIGLYPDSCWHNDFAINETINAGVRNGYLLRQSVTQVEYTQKGVAALQAAQQNPNQNPNLNTTTQKQEDHKMENSGDTVQATTMYKITGKKLAEKFEETKKKYVATLKFTEEKLGSLIAMPETMDKPNNFTGVAKQISKAEHLASTAAYETMNSMSGRKYYFNIDMLKMLKEKSAISPLSKNEEERKTAYKTENAQIRKNYDYCISTEAAERALFIEKNPDIPKNDAPYGPITKQFQEEFRLNCTEDGLKEKVETIKKKLENTTNLLETVKNLPDHEFEVTTTSSLKLSDLKYDANFSKQLDAALAAQQPPAAEKKAKRTRK